MLPITLKIKNFYSHRQSEIDFSQFDSALLIGNVEGNYNISNGSGKSAIMESILWCLFNKARVAAMDDIILWGETICEVILIFKQSNVTYKIRRDRNRISGTSNVEFAYLSDDSDWIDISGSTAKLTNEKIVSILKFDYKTFINSAYFRQNDISEFANSDPSKKKEILKSIIDLSKWDDYEKEGKARLKNLKSEYLLLETKIEELDVDDLELSKANVHLKNLNEEISILKTNYERNDEIFESISNQYQKLKSNLDTDTWDKLVAENEKIKKDAVRLKKVVADIQELISKTDLSISNLKSQKNDLEDKVAEITLDPEIDEKIKNLSDSLIVYKTKLSTANNLLDKIKNRNVEEDSCHVCGQDISKDLYAKLLHNHNSEIEGYKKEIVYSSNKIEECNLLLKKYENVQKDNKKLENFKSKIKNLEGELSNLQNLLDQKNEDKRHYSDELKSLKDKFDANNLALESLKNNDFQKIHEELIKIKTQRKEFEDKIASKNQEIGVVTEKIKNLEIKLSNFKKEKESLYILNKKQIAYEKMVKMMGKNGVQTILLNAVIEDLEKTSNEILSSICNEPMIILLETQRAGSDGVSIVDTLDLKVKKDGFLQNFPSLSGGEQFRVSLALRIALSEISSRHGGSSLEFLLLDEINSPLDKHGTENLFVNVISALEKKYKIIVITHNDSLKEKFSNVLDVTKINGESFATFTQK